MEQHSPLLVRQGCRQFILYSTLVERRCSSRSLALAITVAFVCKNVCRCHFFYIPGVQFNLSLRWGVLTLSLRFHAARLENSERLPKFSYISRYSNASGNVTSYVLSTTTSYQLNKKIKQQIEYNLQMCQYIRRKMNVACGGRMYTSFTNERRLIEAVCIRPQQRKD